MSRCYDLRKWTIVTLGTVAICLTLALLLEQPSHGQSLKELQNQVRLPELETLVNYCYQHADRPNPLQDLIDKGFLFSNFTGETCISVKQNYDDFEGKYRTLLIAKIADSKCYEVWNPNVATSQLEELFLGCDRRGLIK